MLDINKNPTRRDLLIFAAMLPMAFAVVGALRWHAGSPRGALAWWIIGLAISCIVFTVEPARRRLYLAWIYATYPIAWTVSLAILAASYFLVATPIALVLRAFGKDPLRRTLDKSTQSYWMRRECKRDAERYFRQF
jgi:Na+/proline symporter